MKSTRSRSTGRTTLADVARLAGVSLMTASRAMRNAPTVHPDLLEKVQTAALKLGYLPDPAARALATHRSHHVAVLVPMLSNNLFVDVLQAIQETLRPQGFQTLIGITHYDPLEEEQLIKEHLIQRPSGMLITGLAQTMQSKDLIQQSKVACVHMMELSPTPDLYCVGFSQEQAAAHMVRHLLERGRKNIAFVAAQLDQRSLERLQGWRQCLQQAGLYRSELEMLDPTPSSMRLGQAIFQKILQKPELQVDAIFFCNDDLAQGALLEAQRQGISIPQQMAITGFNDLTGSDLMHPPLTTIRTHRSTIGHEAARMLLSLIQGHPPTAPHIDVGYELVVRGSS